MNAMETYAMCLGKQNIYGDEQFGIKFVKSIKILGVYFDTTLAASENPINWESKIEKNSKYTRYVVKTRFIIDWKNVSYF